MAQGELTSISPLITHGNEFRGEIKELNSARHVKTCIKIIIEINLLAISLHSYYEVNY